MSADPIIYCLETTTDYFQFERLASDLMASTDFPGIEPLGGTGDGGRDALHIHRDSGVTTIFAYSVRSDWDTKLRGDCRRIKDTCNHVDAVVFVSTQAISIRKKENIQLEVRELYGWSIEIYDIERIRVLLTGPHKHLLEKHPAIFVSPWFERRGGKLITLEQRDLILIDHIPVDHAFATWLFRKLSISGYSVWCHGLAPLAGENADASVRTLIERRAARYLPVLSTSSARDPNLRGRMTIAANKSNLVLPCWISDVSNSQFDVQLASIVPARFDQSWQSGLKDVEIQFDSGGVKKPIDKQMGCRIALSAYSEERLLIGMPEQVYSNFFSVTVPAEVKVFEFESKSVVINKGIEKQWAYVRQGEFIFSFSDAPCGLPVTSRQPRRFAWRYFNEILGVKSEDLIKMLVKKSLFVACYSVGFRWCKERYTFYLDENKRRRHGYQHVDRVYTHVSLTGERSWGIGERSTKYRYQLGPIFKVAFDERGALWVMLKLYVRVTDCDGNPFSIEKIPSRRKRVTRSWWNRQWFQRTLGIMQFIAGDIADINGKIVVGRGKQAVIVDVAPLSWECPVSIDVEALDRVGDFQAELSVVRGTEDESLQDSGAESDGG